MTRPIVITANWKMYKTIEEAVAFVKGLIPQLKDVTARVYLAVPFTAIKAAADAAEGSPLLIGGQNMNDSSEGAFTGEIAAVMLKEAGAQFVILGHSERRHIFHESNAFINRKIHRALNDGLQPVLCVGETSEEHELGKAKEVLAVQLKESLEGITDEHLSKIILAYEPVWAIGTDKTATPEQAEEIHQYCRDFLKGSFSEKVVDDLVIQYGGSVKPVNASQLLEKPDVDGLLVGSASLNLDFFSQIIHYNTLQNSNKG